MPPLGGSPGVAPWRVCPACGYKRSIALAGRDMGRYRARPGLYQCSNGACRFQFTATTRTPLHATKLPLSTWLKALWLILQSDKGLSSIRLAEALGVSQPTAWRIGHALRLMLARENPLGGTVEIEEFFLGGRPKKRVDEPPPGRGRKGLRRTTKRPVLAVVQRPSATVRGALAGDARASVVANLSMDEVERVLDKEVEPTAHLMSDEWKAFVAVGQNFAAHETVQHGRREYVRGPVHANSVEGFNLRVQRTVAGVFHHISPEHADLYFHEIGFRWSSASSPARSSAAISMAARRPEPCGHACRRHSSCRRSSAPRSAERYGGPASAASSSSQPSLSLVDKSAQRRSPLRSRRAVVEREGARPCASSPARPRSAPPGSGPRRTTIYHSVKLNRPSRPRSSPTWSRSRPATRSSGRADPTAAPSAAPSGAAALPARNYAERTPAARRQKTRLKPRRSA